MSKIQEAIKDGCKGCPKKVCTWGGFVGDCPLNTSGKSEPALNQSGTGQEPGEFTKECRAVIIAGPPKHRFSICVKRLLKACEEIDRLKAELKDLKEMKLWKPENLQSKP